MRTHSHEGCLGRGVMRVVEGYQIKETDSKAEDGKKHTSAESDEQRERRRRCECLQENQSELHVVYSCHPNSCHVRRSSGLGMASNRQAIRSSCLVPMTPQCKQIMITDTRI
jgi:hypothetical protein